MNPQFFVRAIVMLGVLLSSIAGISAGQTSTLSETNRLIPEANLAASLQVFTDTDGGVYAVKLVLTNLSKTNDLILGLSEVPILNLRLLIQVGDQNIGKNLPKIKNYEGHALEMRLNRSSSAEWFVRVADHIENLDKVPSTSSADLIVHFSSGYWNANGEARTSKYTPMWFDLMLAPVVITSDALKGDPTEKYEKSLNKPPKRTGNP